MRILLATSEVPPTLSGMARVADHLIRGFEERGHDVDVLASERLPRVAMRDVRVPLLLLPGTERRVRRRIAAADVVSLHGPIPGFSDLLLLAGRAARGRTPLAYTHHMDIGFRHARWLTGAFNGLQRRLASRAGVVIASTHATAATFRSHRNVQVVPFGVEHERARDERKFDAFTVLFVGQLRPYKGVDVLLRAIARLPGVRLKIAGRGYAERALRAQARGLDNIEFLGGVSDDALWSLYARSHVLAQPSTEMEFFGLAMLEGMASGCVPVISDLPGPSEVLGGAGLVVAHGDDAALAAAIARLRDDTPLRETLAAKARARAAEFTWERCIERHIELYASLVQ